MGVLISICILKEGLEKEGYEVYIFIIIDCNVKCFEDFIIICLLSVFFIFFMDCWVVYRGLIFVYRIVKDYEFDIIYI